MSRRTMPLKRFLQLWVPVACILLAGLIAQIFTCFLIPRLWTLSSARGKELCSKAA